MPGARRRAPRRPQAAPPLGILAALTPVMFAYGGWQTSSFVAGEMRDPRRDLARGLLLGVIGVVVLYTAVALTCVLVLGPDGPRREPGPGERGDAASRSATPARP